MVSIKCLLHFGAFETQISSLSVSRFFPVNFPLYSRLNWGFQRLEIQDYMKSNAVEAVASGSVVSNNVSVWYCINTIVRQFLVS